MLTILLIPLAISIVSVNTAHATTMTGSFTGSYRVVTTFANGTMFETGVFKFIGLLRGNTTLSENDIPTSASTGNFHGVDTFTGSFNGSAVGAMLGSYSGTWDASGFQYAAHTWSGGTGGLAGLQLTVAWQGETVGCPSGTSVACYVDGTYTVTSATWGAKPVPEFSNLALVILFASGVCLTMLRRKRTA